MKGIAEMGRLLCAHPICKWGRGEGTPRARHVGATPRPSWAHSCALLTWVGVMRALFLCSCPVQVIGGEGQREGRGIPFTHHSASPVCVLRWVASNPHTEGEATPHLWSGRHQGGVCTGEGHAESGGGCVYAPLPPFHTSVHMRLQGGWRCEQVEERGVVFVPHASGSCDLGT